MEYLLVGVGGAAGSLARFVIGRAIARKMKREFPWGTFIINISGAFLLGLAVTAGLPGNMYILAADGFLGAFTTFSTFMYEGVELFRGNETRSAIFYILGSLFIGLVGFIIGSLMGNLIW